MPHNEPHWAQKLFAGGTLQEWAARLRASHTGTGDSLDENTIHEIRAYLWSRLANWSLPSDDYDNAVRDLVGAAIDKYHNGPPLDPANMEVRSCYHCDGPLMVPAGSPRIHTCGKCEKSAPDLSAVPSAALEGDRMPSGMTLASFREWLLLWGPVGAATWNDKDGITVPARKDDLLWLADAVLASRVAPPAPEKPVSGSSNQEQLGEKGGE